MPAKSPGKIIGQLKQPQYAVLRALTDQQQLDAASLEKSVDVVVKDRLALARGFMSAAKLLAKSEDPLVRRSAVSRAYYGAYHAARATVFAIRRHDESNHKELAQEVDRVRPGQQAVGDGLRELRQLREEMDYSPYPGPNEQMQYGVDELDKVIKDSIKKARDVIIALQKHLKGRR